MNPEQNTNLFETVAFVGLGLIGGSLALDLQRLRLCQQTIGYELHEFYCQEARQRNLVNSVFVQFNQDLSRADLVVMATPVGSFTHIFDSMLPYLSPGTIVTDVGSVKAPFMKQIQGRNLQGVRFVGGHPIAGLEQFGPNSARTHLFEGKKVVLTPDHTTESFALQKIRQMWTKVGGQVLAMEAEQHDEIFAAVSHLPHLTAFACVHAIVDTDQPDVLQHSGAGLKDFSRIASSSPEMWADIFLENQKQLCTRIESFQQILQQLKKRNETGRA